MSTLDRAVPFVALALVACQPPAAETAAPIVDGTRELGEPAVVAVRRIDWETCTATLISPRVVLTAKHCVQDPGAEGPRSPADFTVLVGDRIDPTQEEHAVRDVETTPGSWAYSGQNASGALVGVDVAVLVLDDPVAGVSPIPIRRDRPDDAVGRTFTAVGFGQRPDGGIDEKYTTTGTVESLTGTVFVTSAVACPGDSGGPMIQETPERRVIGVTSAATSVGCPPDGNTYTAIFEQIDLIDRALVTAGDCLGEDEVCDSLDDDCDGAVDEGCARLGESCSADTDCAFAQLPSYATPIDDPVSCEDVGGASICTRPCDPTRPASSCAPDGSAGIEGLYCRHTGDCGGRCAPGTPGDAADGESCERDTDCRSLACADPGDGRRRCLTPCVGGAGRCAVGEACSVGPGACGWCVDAAIVVAPRRLGEPCERDTQCASGMCAGDVDGYCTRSCGGDGDCAPSYRCRDGRCARGARGVVGDPCTGEGECAAGTFCARSQTRGWCTEFCDGQAACPAELTCTTASEARVCAPTRALLGDVCRSDADCGEGECDDHVCARACDVASGCPVGFECRRDTNGDARCLRPPAGGCAVVPRRARRFPLGCSVLALVACAAVLRRWRAA